MTLPSVPGAANEKTGENNTCKTRLEEEEDQLATFLSWFSSSSFSTYSRACVWVCSIKGANSSACKMIHNNPSTVSFMWRHNPLFTFQNHFFQICDICDIVELQRSKGLILFVLLDGYTYNKNGVWTKERSILESETSYVNVAERLNFRIWNNM